MASSRVTPLRPPTRPTSTARAQSPGRPAVLDYQNLDPLLGNLSPESTLQALSYTDAVPKNEQAAHDILTKSISQVSPAERALGIRAAVVAQKLNLWYKEIQSWEWPNRTDVHLGKGFVPPSDETDIDYYGSLPVAVVEEHEKRIEEIRDGMDVLDVDELKEHVLSAHIPARSRPSSSNSTISVPPPLSYVQLSDFTAVVTATILRALPLLSRLNSLLSTWDVRLLVLRQIPALLRALQQARSELNSALELLRSQTSPGEKDALYSRDNYHARRASLEDTVVSAGRKLDRVLDALEGREDSLPESWIDDLEGIESEFGTWVMEAERRTVENEWRRTTVSPSIVAQAESVQDAPAHSSPESRNHEKLSLNTSVPVSQTGHLETIEEEIGSPTEATPSTEAQGDRGASILESIIPTTALETSNPPFPSTSDATDTTDAVTHPARNMDPIIVPQDDPTSATPNITAPSINASENTDISTDAIQATEPGVSQISQSAIALENDPVVDACDGILSRDEYTSRQSPLSAVENLKSASTLDETTPCAQEETISRTSMDVQPEMEDYPSNITVEAPHCVPKEEPEDLVSWPTLDASPRPSSSGKGLQVPASPDAQSSDTGSVIIRRQTTIAPSPLSRRRDWSENEGEALSETDSTDSVVESRDQLQSTLVEDQEATVVSGKGHAASTDVPAAPSTAQEYSLSLPPVNASLESPGNKDKISSSPLPMDKAHEESQEGRTLKKPLESPIKLSKTRPERLFLEKETSKSRGRRGSIASSLSDYPSLVSSPENREPRTSSSNETPLLLETPPPFQSDYQTSSPMPPGSDHTLREDRLFRLDNQKPSPRASFAHNRNLSLPLQRFINERLELNYEDESGSDMDGAAANRKSTDVFTDLRFGQKKAVMPSQNGIPFSSTKNGRRAAARGLETHREESPKLGTGPVTKALSKAWEHTKSSAPKPANQSALPSEPPAHSNTTRLKRQLTAHPSLESIGAYKSNAQSETSSARAFSKAGSRPTTPSAQMKKHKDHLDEKITSILSSLPTRIHLVSADDNHDGASAATSLPLKARERFRSISPQGMPPRCTTPTPSLTLTAAPSRRRYSHAHAPEESSVKLYHLHRGGKAAPTKLFVRSVGEKGERVMVRVGGGWADLGEYLREYAIHHGRRNVSDTPRVEVQGLSATRTSTSPTYSVSGRRTPSRPRSVLSNRPASSLAVHKTRRTSNVSDVTEFRASHAGETLNSYSPMSTMSSRRRLSASSNASMGAASLASEFRHGSSYSPSATGAGSTHSIPLGLAGPKPRPRHVSISPESEAWVEGVLGQARRSSSLRPYKFGLPPPQEPEPAPVKTPTIPKSRSISDLGTAGSSRRIALRGLANR
ncbi:hypothetical protein BO70DRAFT_116190 [Aspergillus heteromorphus CBS 117.55]|uniref:GAR domain-containing protein n=1 Tax=Aspergillus heteromorphus CBS 117.55 TaxID=1448321 RepID=A0A317VFV7_9EURO|nr:uncharacterized protein BO70DRAFT_116190 [Aspergillus heteromorphus CBS 117.55]PWY72319.1 hypothetical protein BO70DRAFT_116190 [Aspergillus heteromorphus CBS 117.55]